MSDTSPNTSGSSSRWWVDALWLAVLLAWSAWWCLTAGARLGLTFDERLYLNAGLDSWRTGKPELLTTNGVMPLPIDAATWPAYQHEKRTGIKLEDPATVEHLGRARPVTLLWLWLLIVSAYRLGWAAGGSWAGRIAAGLIAADPTMLAHSSLATTDISATAALMAFTRAVYAGRGGGWWKRIMLPGLWYGVAVLCKLSALLYGGIILVTLELAHRVASGHLSRPSGETVADWAVRVWGAALRSFVALTVVIALGIAVAIVYCGFPEPGANPMAGVAKLLPKDAPMKPVYERLSQKYEHMPYGLAAFAFQWWHNARGRPSFLNGTYYPEGTWHFFPVLLAMKTPLPVILLGLAALIRPRKCANPLILVALLMLLPTLKGSVQNGVRLVLPVMALGYVAVAVAVVRGFGRCGKLAGAAAVIVVAATSAWVWPHGLCYLNQPSGGLSAAHERVSDSNVDWGQWMPELVEWHRANGEPPTIVWYFGLDPVADRPPFGRLPVEVLPIRTGEDLRAAVGQRVLAVGSTITTLDPAPTEAKVVALAYLRTLQPVLRTPRFTLYDFRDPAGPPLR